MQLDSHFFKSRRQKIYSVLEPKEALLIPTSPLRKRSHDTFYPFRPNSFFYYLTGFKQEESFLVLKDSKSYLWMKDKDPKKTLWEGDFLGIKEVQKEFDFDSVFSIDDFSSSLKKILQDSRRVFFTDTDLFTHEFQKILSSFKIEKASELIAPLRFQKTDEEVQMIQKSCDIASKAHIALMKEAKEGLSEAYLRGVFLKNIQSPYSQDEAYTSIVASGKNATTLHYTKASSILKKGEILLIDAGAEYGLYASDITRSYPINSSFSKIQKEVYEALLSIQKKLIRSVKKGKTFLDLQNHALEELSSLMKDLNLFKESVSEIIEQKLYIKYFPHFVGHSLGLDVHDGEGLKDFKNLPLEKNSCITIEPGIYIPEDDPSCPKDLRGLGLRIEDDLRVLDNGSEVLSSKCPKEISELESLIKG